MTKVEEELKAIEARKPVMFFAVDVQADSIVTFTAIAGDNITTEMHAEFSDCLKTMANLLRRSA